MIRLLAFGGRDYRDRTSVYRVLDRIHRDRVISVLIVGRCETGADRIAEDWADERGITVDPYPAKWEDVDAPGAVIRYRRDGAAYNVLAGPWRNQEQIDKGKHRRCRLSGRLWIKGHGEAAEGR